MWPFFLHFLNNQTPLGYGQHHEKWRCLYYPKEATCKCAYMNMKDQLNYFINRLSITHAKVHPKIAWMHHLAAEKKVKK